MNCLVCLYVKIRNGQRIYELSISAWMPMTSALVRKLSFNTLKQYLRYIQSRDHLTDGIRHKNSNGGNEQLASSSLKTEAIRRVAT